MSKTIKLLSIITIILVGAIILGLNIFKTQNNSGVNKIAQNDEKEEILDECTDEYNEYENESLNANSSEEKVSPNCKITFRIFYTKCNDEINEYVKVPENLVNCSKEKVQNQYKDWEVREFSSENIVLYKQLDEICGQHYILKQEDGKIVIYKLSEDGREVLYERTEIAIDYLPNKDKEAIKEGYKVCGKEKLNKLIESFE